MVSVYVDNRQHISGLSDKQIKTLRDYLTVVNPKYEQAKKFSKWGAPKSIPRSLYYYVYDGKGKMTVPAGVRIGELLGVEPVYDYLGMHHDEEYDELHIEYPDFLYTLRREQKDAFDAYNKDRKRVNPHNVVHLPTGKGKTILALYIAWFYGLRTLVLVHKGDLLDGWKSDIKDVFGGKVEPGIIQGKKRKCGNEITLAMVQTLNNYKDDAIKEIQSHFGLIVQDEVHHVGANTFNIIDTFNAPYKLGLSATPHRKDGLDCCLDFFLGGLCYEYSYKKHDEDICDVRVLMQKSKFRYTPALVLDGKYKGKIINIYDNTKIKFRDDQVEYLGNIDYAKRPKVNYSVLDSSMAQNDKYRRQVLNDIYREYDKGRSVLALFKQKENLDLFYSSFTEFVPEDKVMRFYGDSKEDNADLMQRAEKKEVLVTFATMGKASEGTNVKSWEVLFLVSPIVDSNNVEQAVGRIRRRKDGKLKEVLVYDYYSDDYTFRNQYPKRLETYRKLKCVVDFLN